MRGLTATVFKAGSAVGVHSEGVGEAEEAEEAEEEAVISGVLDWVA